MKRLVSLISMAMLAALVSGQTDAYEAFRKQQLERFATFSDSQQAEYNAYRRRLNEEYARFMEESWERFVAMEAVEAVREVDVPPVVYEEKKGTAISSDAFLNFIAIPLKDEVVKLLAPSEQPEPIAPIAAKEIESEVESVAFYGTLVSIPFPKEEAWSIAQISEKPLAKAWRALSAEEYDMTLQSALNVRKHMNLCDWGYMQLLQQVCEKRYGMTAKARMMQAYLMAQSGYKVRLAYAGEQLYMLVASDYNILSMFYFVVDGEKFYPMNCMTKELSICKAAFDVEKKLSLQIAKEQNLDADVVEARRLSSKYGIRVEVQQNKNLMDFYAHYPSSYMDGNIYTRWAVYANTPLDAAMAASLYPALREAIAGMSERDAVNKLLNFVQTAFEYEYDETVWGADRAFFAEETLCYPYADCEDRAVLFSRLVRDLLGLDVVLLYYPGHLATAVAFGEAVAGDYLVYGNRKYVVCDPTYIGAPVGRTMPNMNNQEAQVIVLQ